MNATYYVAELDYGTKYGAGPGMIYPVCQFSDVENAEAMAKDFSETQGPAGVAVKDPDGEYRSTGDSRYALLRAFRDGEEAAA